MAGQERSRAANGVAADNVEPLRASRECPACGKPSQRKTYPFCSSRCADVDLNRWFTGSYAIATQEPPDEFEG